jgi:predicted Zn-dependent protease
LTSRAHAWLAAGVPRLPAEPKRRLPTASIVAALLAVGCARNPVSGHPEFVVISESSETELGDAAARQIEGQMGIVDAPALGAYVQAVGERLAAQSPRREVTYRFSVVDRAEPNAFALPGGHVYVTRGLLALLEGEDELAGVLGHEIGHVAARHAVQRVSRAAPIGILTGVVAVAGGVVSPSLGRMVGGAGSTLNEALLAPYSRDQEREADRIGQDTAARAGWDPAGLARALATMGRVERLQRKQPERTSFLDSHPGTAERVADVQARASQVSRGSAAPIAATRDDFLRRLDGLVVGEGAAQGVFDGRLFRHPDLGFAVQFPDGWKTENGREQVAAVSSDERAAVAVTLEADGDDPMAGARALEKASKRSLPVTPTPTTINGLPAARASLAADADGGRYAIEIAWIALFGRVFQVAGLAAQAGAAAVQPRIDATIGSFRALAPGERADIRERRLRLEPARSGETATALAKRTGTPWGAELVAAVNAVEPEAPLPAGRLMKIARSERYGGR